MTHDDLKNKSPEELIELIRAGEHRLQQLAQLEEEHRQAEQRLEESERRYRTLTENIALGLYRRTAGTAGQLVMVNRAMVDMFRYDSCEELLDIPIRDLYWDPAECIAFSARMYKDRQVIRQQLKMKRRDGTPIWVAVTATVICQEAEEVTFFDGILEDITERKQIEAEKALRQQQLIHADKMISLGVLVSGVAHEINNPNQFIVTNLSPLRRCMEDALPILDRYAQSEGDFMLGGRRYSMRRKQMQEMFGNIAKGAERIRNIVNELRDYARENPCDTLETVHLNNVVQSALALLSPLIKKHTRHFTVLYAQDLPPIQGIYQRLEQVLINLIQNACQALNNPKDSITVRTYHDLEQQAVCVEITDTGIGIEAEDLLHVTDPFFTTKRSSGGSGLGLSISSSIMKEHHGSLTFESQPGQGTTALVSLSVNPSQEVIS